MLSGTPWAPPEFHPLTTVDRVPRGAMACAGVVRRAARLLARPALLPSQRSQAPSLRGARRGAAGDSWPCPSFTSLYHLSPGLDMYTRARRSSHSTSPSALPHRLQPEAAKGSPAGKKSYKRRLPKPAFFQPDGNSIEGMVSRITFHNQQNGWTVMKVNVAKAGEAAVDVTVVGTAGKILPGEYVEAEGTWVNNKDYGFQLQASHIKSKVPTGAEALAKYLGSGSLRGIGPVYGERIVDHFGAQALEVIERNPQALLEVPGIGPGRLKKIVSSWATQKHVWEIFEFLQVNGVPTVHANRIYKKFQDRSIAILKENPYRLTDIRGIGFLTADKVALQLGMAHDSMERVRAGIQHALFEKTSEGHVGFPEAKFYSYAAELLQVEVAQVQAGVREEQVADRVVVETMGGEAVIFNAALHRIEHQIAALLAGLAAGSPPWPAVDAAAATLAVEQEYGIQLSGTQRDAIQLAVRSKITVITGGPGVGKTMLMKCLLRVVTHGRRLKVLLAAPTGKAAKRLAESTGRPAMTIHRMLDAGRPPQGPGDQGRDSGQFGKGADDPLECDLLVVDEASMLDVQLARSLLVALPRHAALVLVGDVDQLPSVGPGQVLRDVIDSGVVPTVELREIFRQAADSLIVTNSHAVNCGRMPAKPLVRGPGSDFYIWDVEDSEAAEACVVDLVTERIPAKFGLRAMEDIQVLTPRNKGSLGVEGLNPRLQDLLNPLPPGAPEVTKYGRRFRAGDKVMMLMNDYDREVYNGDMGQVERVELEQEALVVQFGGLMHEFPFDELDCLTLAYATTIHKSQGSEYRCVVLPITMQAYTMLQRNLLYTGMTRGKELVVLVSQQRALSIAVKHRGKVKRYSSLLPRLQEHL